MHKSSFARLIAGVFLLCAFLPVFASARLSDFQCRTSWEVTEKQRTNRIENAGYDFPSDVLPVFYA